ncbi:unnamed protein product [Adineta steineri]|uniref:Ricin B lectin domain-containing protein n=1 Tax=Adineta steineri TaxID=433720 RepID=A0A818LW38_9BILA|nr:unnamed protein product [Adineta steineri]CAF0760007.1 unnamed protein product [Adineta steineri]CAF0768728.1 unnamed protein product [Adineta steineri]CAF0972216.1 unnamed protein product [Adineta steineri]CAF3513362.1 unnamed protein product [Adineta steineri]
MHDQWYFASENIPDGLYLIESIHSGKFITFTPERSTLVQQDQNLQNDGETQVFEIQHIGYHDYVIRHHLTGLVLTVHNGSPTPCAPIVLCRSMGIRTPYQTVNFERSNNQSDDFIIYLKHTRMVIDIDGGSQSSNARLLQFPQKKNNSFEQLNQRFRLHPVVDRTSQQSPIIIPDEFFR